MAQDNKFIDPRHALNEMRGEATEAVAYDDLEDGDGGPFADDADADALENEGHAENEAGATSDDADKKASATDDAAKSGAIIIPHESADKKDAADSTKQQSVLSDSKGDEKKSLFDQSLQKPAAGAAQENAEGAKQPIRLNDDDLVEFNGELVPFHTIKGGVMLKKEYDKNVTKLEAEKSKVASDKAAIEVAKPYVEAMINDSFGKAYMESLVNTGGDQEKALKIAAITSGRTIVAQDAKPEQVDPRLVPPTDTNGQPLEDDDPRYLKWLAEAAPIKAEIAAERKWNELEAEKERKALVESQARESKQREEEADREKAQSFTSDVEKANMAVLKTLPAVLLARGVDVNKLTHEQWAAAKTQFAEAAVGYGKNVVSDDWLQQNLLDKSDIGLIVDASGLVAKISGGGNASKGEENSGAKAPEKVAEVESVEGAMDNGAQDPKIGRLRVANNPRRPLNASGPSQAIAGIAEGRDRPASPDEGWQGAHSEMRGKS